MTEPILERAKLAHRAGDLKRALELSEDGLSDPAVSVSPRTLHDLWVLKSHCLNALGRWQEALAALEFAAQAGEIDVEANVCLVMHKGYLMGSLARYAECWSLLGQAEQTARELNLPSLLAEILWRRGIMSIFVGDYNSADQCLSSALEIVSKKDNPQLQGLIMAGLAKNTMYRGEYSAAIPRFEDALAIFEELDMRFYSAIVQGELGTCYMYLGETEKALKLLQQTAEIFTANGAIAHYQVSLADIGNVYLRRREFLTAISYYQRALELARQLGDQLSIGKWLRNLAQAYTQLGNPTLAKGFEDEAKSANDQLAAERQRAAQIAASFK